MRRPLLFGFLLPFLFATPLSAFYLDLKLAQGFSSDVPTKGNSYEFLQISLGESFFQDIFHVETSLQFWIDQRFKGLESKTPFYFRFNYGGLRVTWEGLNIELGYFQPQDQVDSPYGLFLNSAYVVDTLASSLAKPAANIGYENKYVFFQMNWTALAFSEYGRTFGEGPLNIPNPVLFPNRDWFELQTGNPGLTRGYSYKVFGGKVGAWRFGYQDSVIYDKRIFDWAYATLPLPSVLVQYTRNSLGNPGAEDINDQALMGFFLSYDDERRYYGYAQLLINDVSLNTILGKVEQNPFKLAWSMGGWYTSDYGRFGFFHAGATKYLFQGVEYKPGKSYSFAVFNYFGDKRFLRAQDTWIGYKNGENNISFMLAYQNKFMSDRLRYQGAVELTITGSQSPNGNPWTEFYRYYDDGWGTRILVGPVETKVLFYNSLSYLLTDWLDLSLDANIGFAHNALKLYFPQPDEQPNMYPYLKVGNQTKLLFDVRIGVRFFFDWDFFNPKPKKGDRPQAVVPLLDKTEIML